MDQGLSVPIDDPGAQWTQDFIDSQPEPQTPRLVFPSLDPGADILFTDLPDPMDCWLDTVYNAGDHNDERLGPNYTHDTTSPSAQLSESTYPTRLPHIATESDLMDIGDATSDTSNQNFTVSDRRLQKGGSAISPAPTPSGESLDRDDADNSYPLQDHRSSIASMSPSPSVPPSHNHSTDQTLFRSPNSPPSLLATPSPVPVPQPAPSAQGKLQCPQCEKCFLKQSLLRLVPIYSLIIARPTS